MNPFAAGFLAPLLLACLLASGGTFGCASPAPGRSTASPSSASADTNAALLTDLAPGDTAVTLERLPCFGTCPSYTLAITAGGDVQYDGREYVAVKDRAQRTIPADSVQHLVQTLIEGGYFELRDSYVAGEPCQEQYTDMPTVITSVDTGTRQKRVEHYYGCQWDGREQLIALEDTIDAVAGSRRWVEG